MPSNDLTSPRKKAVVPPARPLPQDALDALRKLRDTSTQAQIARRLNVSEAAISSALNGRYIGNVEKLAERIRGELLNETVACPVLGSISTRICQDERVKPFSAATNPMRVQLWKQCQTCPHNPRTSPAKGNPE